MMEMSAFLDPSDFQDPSYLSAFGGCLPRRLNIRPLSPNVWRLDVRIRQSNKELRRRETFWGTPLAAAKRFMQRKLELQELARKILPRKLKDFRDYLELYREKRPNYDRSKYADLDQNLGHILLTNLPNALEEFLRRRRTEPAPTTGRPLTNASLNRIIVTANSVLNLAVKMELLDKNPISKYRFPKYREVARDRFLSDEEQEKLLNVLRGDAPHLFPMVKYALQVPCRRSELVNMKRTDLDLAHEAIRVRNGTTKNDIGIWKPIPPNMLEYFRSIPTDCPYLFYRVKNGRYLPLICFRKAWVRCLEIAGITDFRLHDTRHVSATNLLDNGTPEHVVLQVAGWKTNMLKTYYHRDGKRALALVRFSTPK